VIVAANSVLGLGFAYALVALVLLPAWLLRRR
jgi:hypothetical protein